MQDITIAIATNDIFFIGDDDHLNQLHVKIAHELLIPVYLIISLDMLICSQPMLVETLAASEWRMMTYVRSIVLVISF